MSTALIGTASSTTASVSVAQAIVSSKAVRVIPFNKLQSPTASSARVFALVITSPRGSSREGNGSASPTNPIPPRTVTGTPASPVSASPSPSSANSSSVRLMGAESPFSKEEKAAEVEFLSLCENAPETMDEKALTTASELVISYKRILFRKPHRYEKTTETPFIRGFFAALTLGSSDLVAVLQERYGEVLVADSFSATPFHYLASIIDAKWNAGHVLILTQYAKKFPKGLFLEMKEGRSSLRLALETHMNRPPQRVLERKVLVRSASGDLDAVTPSAHYTVQRLEQQEAPRVTTHFIDALLGLYGKDKRFYLEFLWILSLVDGEAFEKKCKDLFDLLEERITHYFPRFLVKPTKEDLQALRIQGELSNSVMKRAYFNGNTTLITALEKWGYSYEEDRCTSDDTTVLQHLVTVPVAAAVHIALFRKLVRGYPKLVQHTFQDSYSLSLQIMLYGHGAFLKELQSAYSPEVVERMFVRPIESHSPLHAFFADAQNALNEDENLQTRFTRQKDVLGLLVSSYGSKLLEIEFNNETVISAACRNGLVELIPDEYYKNPTEESLLECMLHMSEQYSKDVFGRIFDYILPDKFKHLEAKFMDRTWFRGQTDVTQLQRALVLDTFFPLSVPKLQKLQKIVRTKLPKAFGEFLFKLVSPELKKQHERGVQEQLVAFLQMLEKANSVS